MSHDRESHDWARNHGRRILGIDPERRRNTGNGGDRRARPAAPVSPRDEFAEPPVVDRSGDAGADERA